MSAVHPRNENLGLYNIDAVVSKDCCINPSISHIFDNMLIFHRTLHYASICSEIELCVPHEIFCMLISPNDKLARTYAIRYEFVSE